MTSAERSPPDGLERSAALGAAGAAMGRVDLVHQALRMACRFASGGHADPLIIQHLERLVRLGAFDYAHAATSSLSSPAAAERARDRLVALQRSLEGS